MKTLRVDQLTRALLGTNAIEPNIRVYMAHHIHTLLMLARAMITEPTDTTPTAFLVLVTQHPTPVYRVFRL